MVDNYSSAKRSPLRTHNLISVFPFCPSLPVQDFREKNTDHMRPDIVALLKSSKSAFICNLMGINPVATFRWAVLRAYFRAVVAFKGAGKRHTEKRSGESIKAQTLSCSHVFPGANPQNRSINVILAPVASEEKQSFHVTCLSKCSSGLFELHCTTNDAVLVYYS